MKKIILFFCLISLSVSGFSQMLDNIVDAKGLRQGPWKSYSPEGKLKFEGQFKDDVPFGVFTYYYPDGKKKAVTTFEEKGITKSEVFHKNGELMAKGLYKNKKREGQWLFYSEVDGALISEENYKNGSKNGPMKTFYPESAKLAEEVSFVNDWEEGDYKQYFENGQILAEGKYKAGKLYGPFNYFFSDGKPKIKGQYEDGLKMGFWSFYDESGDLIKKEKFVKGKSVDTEIFKEAPSEEMQVIDEEELKKSMKN